MYEILVENKILVMVSVGIVFVLLSVMAVLASRLLQGNTKRVLTGPLYSTYITIGIMGIITTFGGYLIYLSDKISMAVGICLVVFSFMVLGTVFMLAFAAKTYKKPSENSKKFFEVF